MSAAFLYLFLDFDGVLHSEVENTPLFEHAGRLGDLMARYPEVRTVVSSLWRTSYSLKGLQSLCGPSLGRCIVGSTPVFNRSDKDAVQKPAGYYERFEEIAAWLAFNTRDAAPRQPARSRDDWIAIDDSDFLFPPGCRQLLHVEDGTGLNDQHFPRARSTTARAS